MGSPEYTWAVCGKHLACEYTVVSGGSVFSRESQSSLSSSSSGDDILGPTFVAMGTSANSSKQRSVASMGPYSCHHSFWTKIVSVPPELELLFHNLQTFVAVFRALEI